MRVALSVRWRLSIHEFSSVLRSISIESRALKCALYSRRRRGDEELPLGRGQSEYVRISRIVRYFDDLANAFEGYRAL